MQEGQRLAEGCVPMSGRAVEMLRRGRGVGGEGPERSVSGGDLDVGRCCER